MIRNSYLNDKINNLSKIIDYMEDNLTLKFGDLIIRIEQELRYNQRSVERYIKTITGLTPKEYFEKRRVTVAIDELVVNKLNINKVCRKYRYKGKFDLSNKCEKYFIASLEEIVRERDIFPLQERITKDTMIKLNSIGEDFANVVKVLNLGTITRKYNSYKLKLTPENMSVFVIPELYYNRIMYELDNNKISKKECMLRIISTYRSLKEKTNNISLTDKEVALIEYGYCIYNFTNPLNIEGICYIGVNNNFTKKYAIENEPKTMNIINTIKVRYLGGSAATKLENGDKMMYHFFTKKINCNIKYSTVDFIVSISEKEFDKIISRVYEKHKDEPIQLDNIDENLLDENIKKLLNGKINNLRYGDFLDVDIAKEDIVNIRDFYPKTKIIIGSELEELIQYVIRTLNKFKIKGVDFNNIIIPTGYEVINKIFRGFDGIRDEKIRNKWMKIRSDFDKFEDLFVDLSKIYVYYFKNMYDKKELEIEMKRLISCILSEMKILKKLYKIL